MRAFAKIVEDHHLRAGRRLLAAEVEAHRLAALYDNYVRRIATLDQDHGLLIATRGDRRTRSALARSPKEPGNASYQHKAYHDRNDVLSTHDLFSFSRCVSFGCQPRR